jgi:pyruvate,water dikinase
MGDVFIRWLSSLSKDDVKLVGGKGANLGEMYNSKFPVPQAFAITTDAFFYFLKETKLEPQIREILNKIDVDNTDKLTSKAQEIRDLITTAKMPEKLQLEILEAYDHFSIDLDPNHAAPGALAILRSAREPIFVSVRSSATAEDLGDASFAGQQDSFINVKGNVEVIEKVKKVFASIFTARSIYYRKKKGFDALVGISAIVQRMINSDKAGVMFSKHPVKNNDEILIEAVFGQGEGIVSGKIKPDHYVMNAALEIITEQIVDKKIAIVRTASGQTKTITLTPEKSHQRVLKTYELKQLAEYAMKLEKHYKKPQDIEFAIENDEIFIVQTRPITTLKENYKTQEFVGRVLCEGMPASPGIASGPVKIIRGMDELNKIKPGDILVTTMTNPDMVVTMQKASGIVTSEGGVTAHAAIVSREMGIPAVVGAENALDVLQDGQEITVDGFNGKVFAGKAENKKVEILPIVPTKLKIKVLVDLPQFAERAAKTNAYGIGLVRLEGLIASSGKHPLGYKEQNRLEDYKEMLKTGLDKIAQSFINKPIWVRTSDIRSDEYSHLEGAPKEIEKNPMLGNHGIRFSLKHPEIFKSELLAIKELSDKGHKFGVMFPQIISAQEVAQAKKICNELEMNNVSFGVMIETPAAVSVIKEICEEGIEFISFGTNDLTQFTLAIDRGNEHVQHLYNEMNPAVLRQISSVIKECKEHGIETSICGQAGSKKEMVEFLLSCGIDSISVNADVARELSEFVQKLENGQMPLENNKHINTAKIEPLDNLNSVESIIKERESLEHEKIEEIKEAKAEVKEENKEEIEDVDDLIGNSDIEIIPSSEEAEDENSEE